MHEINYFDYEQGGLDWKNKKIGLISASNAYKLLMGLSTAGFIGYTTELAVERLTGVSAERYVTKQMQYGTETEPVARTMYTLVTGNEVKQTGIYVIEGKNAGASLDGEVGDEGLIEIKCRELANHVESLAKDKVPPMYYKQMQFQMWVTHRTWGDYVSYCDEMPENAQLFIKRVERDEEMIADIEERYEIAERRIEDITGVIRGFKLDRLSA